MLSRQSAFWLDWCFPVRALEGCHASHAYEGREECGEMHVAEEMFDQLERMGQRAKSTKQGVAEPILFYLYLHVPSRHCTAPVEQSVACLLPVQALPGGPIRRFIGHPMALVSHRTPFYKQEGR